MTPEVVLSRPARVLTRHQRESYFERGCAVFPGLVDAQWLQRLNAVTDTFIEASREAVAGGDRRFDLEPDHCAAEPRIRRLNTPVELSETYWEFASRGPFADVAEDLLGPDFKFHHSKLNFKWGGGGEEVKWHQDIQFWPHTNSSERPRPLLLCAYSAADAFPITALTAGASHSEALIRGKPARWARFDPRPCLMPPDWSRQGGYKSIFADQQKEA